MALRGVWTLLRLVDRFKRYQNVWLVAQARKETLSLPTRPVMQAEYVDQAAGGPAAA